MAVGDEEIGVQFFEVQVNHTDPMSAINDTKNALLTTDFCETLKRHPHTRHAHDGVEDSDLDVTGVFSYGLHEAKENFLISIPSTGVVSAR